MLYVFVNIGQKIHRTKFLPTRRGGKIGENFQFLTIRYWLLCVGEGVRKLSSIDLLA